MTMTYGKTTPTHYTDPEVVDVNVCTTRLGQVIPAGQHVIDHYPFLKYIPSVASTLRQWHKEELGLFSRMVDQVRLQVVSLVIVMFLDADLIEICRRKAMHGRHLQRICWTISRNMNSPTMNLLILQGPCSELGLIRWVRFYFMHVHSADANQTATAISFVIMAAATHLQAQAEVQAELDAIVGKDRGQW
jgi:hypothetical protein